MLDFLFNSKKNQKAEWYKLLSKEPDIMRRMALVEFGVDSIKDPEGALSRSKGLPDGTYEKWKETEFKQLVKDVANATGADPAQIANKDTRTEEQQNALIEAAGRKQIERFDAFFDSNFMQAFEAFKLQFSTVDDLVSTYPDQAAIVSDSQVQYQAVSYFFATHPRINPRIGASLTANDIERLKTIYARMQAFYAQHRADEARTGRDILEDFIRQENPNNVKTTYPSTYIMPTDKISLKAFADALTSKKELKGLAMEPKGSKREITTYARIDFESITGDIQITGEKALTPYDRAVHDAIITLYVEGGNEYITPSMIYQVMTGNPKNRLEEKQAITIKDSVKKCLHSTLVIDASKEAKKYGFKSLEYTGKLIIGEEVKAVLNNNTVLNCLHILRVPVLYEYADRKNQIGRFDIKLLNSPIRKTAEIITLQDYLSRRIVAMKGSGQKTIVYETVYKQIESYWENSGDDVSIDASEDVLERRRQTRLRKKKAKVREQIRTILDYWKEQGFIIGYVENTRKAEKYSVTIQPKLT